MEKSRGSRKATPAELGRTGAVSTSHERRARDRSHVLSDTDAKDARAIKRRLGPFERFVAVVAAGVTLFAGVSLVRGALATSKARDALLERRDATLRTLPKGMAEFPARLSSWIQTAAKPSADVVSPRAAEAMRGRGIYVRHLDVRAKDDAEIARATSESKKDGLAMCLLGTLRDGRGDSLEAAAEGCGDHECMDADPRLANLREVNRGLEPFGASWRARAEQADALEIAFLSGDFEARKGEHLARAEDVVGGAGYVLVVVDEVPKGFELPFYGSGLDAVAAVPHEARVAVFDAKSGEALVRMTLPAGNAPLVGERPSAAAERQAESCALGLDVADRILDAGRLAERRLYPRRVRSRPMDRLASYKRPDHYTRAAKKQGYPARSVFKLEEIDRRTKLLRPGQRVLDLGAAPGSWSLYVCTQIGAKGQLVAVDLQPLAQALPPNARFHQVDARKLEDGALMELAPYDVVLSDMAPNTTGNRATDQARSFVLFDFALDVAANVGAKGSSFVGKIFMGPDFEAAKTRVRDLYEEPRIIRPEGTRSSSYEVFLIGLRKR